MRKLLIVSAVFAGLAGTAVAAPVPPGPVGTNPAMVQSVAWHRDWHHDRRAERDWHRREARNYERHHYYR
jgi:hypothetical protein